MTQNNQPAGPEIAPGVPKFGHSTLEVHAVYERMRTIQNISDEQLAADIHTLEVFVQQLPTAIEVLKVYKLTR